MYVCMNTRTNEWMSKRITDWQNAYNMLRLYTWTKQKQAYMQLYIFKNIHLYTFASNSNHIEFKSYDKNFAKKNWKSYSYDHKNIRKTTCFLF